MQVKELYLLRHGETGLHGRYIGATDAPLTQQGRVQVRKTGLVLRQKGIAKILCSPLLRCRQTMTELNLPVAGHVNDLLREIDFGRWEGKNFAEIVQLDQDLVDCWVADPHRFTFPDGESLTSFTDRIAAFTSELEQMVEETLLVVAHGGVIRHLLCQLLRLPGEKYLVFDIEPACFCSIRLYPEGGVLTGFNMKG